MRSTHLKSDQLRSRLHEIIFEADTPAGKAFDVALLVCILISVVTVSLESVASMRDEFGSLLRAMEWGLTALFTLEYFLRLSSVHRPGRYATSFFGVVDLLAVIPTYLSLLVPGAQSLVLIRTLRLLRVFRVLKLVQHSGEAKLLMAAMRASRPKITVFLGAQIIIVLIVGALMYLIESSEAGFTSIPQSVYWAIVTMTTVGYGDIAPVTVPGRSLASVLMILGYSIIAVPTGIVTVELAQTRRMPISTQACPSCSAEGHDADAVHCKYCGTKL